MTRFAWLLVPALLTACGGGWSVTSAQRSLELSATVVQGGDEQLAPIVAQAVTRCDGEHEDRESFVECVEPYQPIRYGVSLSRRALRLGQAVVDAWRTGENEGEAAWLPIAACIGHGLGEIAGAIRSLDLEVPELLAQALGWIDAFGALVAGVCPSDLMGVPGE